MSIKGSHKGNFGGVNAVPHIGSGQNIRTNIIPVLTKDGTEVLVATGFYISEDSVSWSQNHTEKLELVINQKQMISTYWVSPHHNLS